MVESFRPDVAHVHTPFPLVSPAVFRATHAAGVPTVATVHSFRLACIAATCVRDEHICEDCVGKRLKWPAVAHRCYHDSLAGSAALATSLSLHRAIGTFRNCVARYLTMTGFAKRLLERDGFPAERIVVKPNSVPDPGLPSSGPDADRYVFFAGRLIGVKGVRTLLEAWSRAAIPNLRLVIAGDGDLRDHVRGAAQRDASIEALGWLGEDEVTALMARATACLVPSEWYEAGAPLVALRSLSVGTPVIATDLENVSAELVEDGAALVFRCGNAADLAAVLREAASRPERLDDMRVAARASYRSRYAPDVDLQRLTEIYAAVCPA